MKDDTISRRAALDALEKEKPTPFVNKDGSVDPFGVGRQNQWYRDGIAIMNLPPVQPERCEYYALCRHGRDENKLRSALGVCDYCTEDSDGYVKPIEKNCHAFIRFGMNGWELSLKANGWHGSAKINFCPMCGRSLTHE